MSTPALRWGVRALLVGAFVLASATPSFAPHVAQLQVSPAQAKAGQEVTVFGPRGYGRTNPVEVRAGSVDGPILGTFQPNEELYALWGPGTVKLPDNIPAGTYALYATQTLAPSETHIRGIPARGEVTIVGSGGAPVLGGPPEVPLADQAKVGILEEKPVSTGAVLLVGLGVAGAALFVAGGGAAVSSRRRAAQPVASQQKSTR